MEIIEPPRKHGKFVAAYYDHDGDPLQAVWEDIDYFGIKQRTTSAPEVIPYKVKPDGEMTRLDEQEDFIGVFTKKPGETKEAFSEKIAKNIEQYLWNM